MAPNVQNATRFSLNRRCRLDKCNNILMNANRTGVCTNCQMHRATEFHKVVDYDRAISMGQDSLVLPTLEDLAEEID